MNSKRPQPVERAMYAARFRRNLTSLNRALNDPHPALQRVVVQSRRTGQAIAVLMAASAYAAVTTYMKSRRAIESNDPSR